MALAFIRHFSNVNSLLSFEAKAHEGSFYKTDYTSQHSFLENAVENSTRDNFDSNYLNLISNLVAMVSKHQAQQRGRRLRKQNVFRLFHATPMIAFDYRVGRWFENNCVK